MGAYLDKPIVEKEREEGCGDGFKFACTSMQGWRANQEDAHNAVVNLHDGWNMFAVYDGHGGSEVSKFTASRFPEFLKEKKFWEIEHPEECLKKAFVDFDDFIRSEDSMKELAKMSNDGKEQNDDDDSEDEADRINTIEEKDVPFHELIKRYGNQIGGNNAAKHLFSAFLKSKENDDDEDENDNDEDEDDEGNKEESEKDNKDETENATENKQSNEKTENKQSNEKAENTDVVDEFDNEDKTDDSTGEKKLSNLKKRCNKSPIQNAVKKSKSDDAGDFQASEDKPNSTSNSSGSKTKLANNSDGKEVEEEYDDDDDEDDEEFVADEDTEDEELDDEDEENDFENFVLNGGAERAGEDSGTTACVCLVGPKKIIVANAGDSRAVLCRAGRAIDLSVDHKPEDDIETARITKAGGSIEDGRVNGGLNLSRALGDHSYKKNTDLPLKDQMITALPDVKIEELTNEDEFLVVACDGIWNSMESQQVVDFVKQKLSDGKTCAEICDALCDACLADSTCGDGTGCDNMTVICAQFVR